jgi:hypothetical protein
MAKFQSKKQVLSYLFIQPFKSLFSPIINLINWWTNLPLNPPPDWEKLISDIFKNETDIYSAWDNPHFLSNNRNFSQLLFTEKDNYSYRIYDDDYIIIILDGILCVIPLPKFVSLFTVPNPYELAIYKLHIFYINKIY